MVSFLIVKAKSTEIALNAPTAGVTIATTYIAKFLLIQNRLSLSRRWIPSTSVAMHLAFSTSCRKTENHSNQPAGWKH